MNMKRISYLLLIIVLLLGTMLLSSCDSHKHVFTETVVDPTCSTEGYTEYYCAECGYSKRANIVSVDYSAHNYYDVKEVPSSCTEHGFIKQRCSICFVENVVQLPLAEHTYGDWTVKEVADCDGGVDTRACVYCPAFEDRETSPVHTYTAVVTAPTCTSKGYTTHICACGDSYKDSETDIIDHVMGNWVVVDPIDCDGGLSKRTCLYCTYTEEMSAEPQHVIVKEITPPTCVRGGYTTYRCSEGCGYEYFRDYVDPTGHTYEETTVEEEATCYSEGKIYHIITCYCGDSYTKVEYLGYTDHQYEEYYVEQPTCTGYGYTYYMCKVCYSYKYVDISPTGHGDLVFIETVAPTCTSDGYTIRECPDCGMYFYGDFVSMLYHDMDAGVVTENTCTEHGYTTYSCQRENCNYHYVDNLTQPAHKEYTWEVILEAYCPDLGIKKGTCVCGDVIYAAYEAHRYDAVVTAPTCTEQGYTTHTCEGCNDVYVDTIVPANGHDWDYSIEVVPPRYDADGYVIETCHCGEFRHVDIKPLSISDGLNFKLEYSDDGYILSRLGSCTDTEVAIPKYIAYFEEYIYNALPVTEIRYYTFHNYTELTTVTIPKSVRVIGISAFENCTNLTTIVFEGTMEEWNNVVKHNNWDLNTGDYTVYCSDGNIAK